MRKSIPHAISVSISVLIIITTLFFVPVHSARAIFGIGDITFDPTNWIESISQFAQTVAKWIADEAFVALRDAAVKRIVDDMTDQIVRSIQNGGEPLFVQDFNSYLNDAGDLAFDEVNNFLMRDADLSLCAPFRPQLTLYFYNNIAAASGGSGARNFGFPATCRFQDFQQNIKNTATFIQNGGWVGIQQLFLPQNNLLSATLALESSYYSKSADIVREKTASFQSNNGYLSVKNCLEWTDPSTDARYSSESQLRAATASYCSDLVKKGIADSVQSCQDIQIKSWCSKEETVTPGDVVAKSAAQSVLKDFPYAENVQSVLSSLVNVFIKNVFDKGKGLLTASKSSGGSGSRSSTFQGVDRATTEKTLDDKRKNAERSIDDIDHNYYLIWNLFNETGGLFDQIRLGRSLAAQAVYNCYMGASKDSYNGYPYGHVAYEFQKGMRYTANLADLINMPLSQVSQSYVISGESSVLDLVQRNTAFEATGSQNGRIFPPVSDPSNPIPSREGYFENLLRGLISANDTLTINRNEIKSLKNELNTISTSSVVYEKGSNGELRSIDNTASSTLALSQLVQRANTAYSTFVGDYKKYVTDALISTIGNSGPGTLNNDVGTDTLQGTLKVMIEGLLNWDETVDSKGSIYDKSDGGHGNFYYCRFRK